MAGSKDVRITFPILVVDALNLPDTHKSSSKYVLMVSKKMPSARIELAILSLHTEVILVIRFTTKPRGLDLNQGIPT